MSGKPIDVWDVETFDEDLLSKLREAADLITGYIETDRKHFLEREKSQHRFPHATNRYAGDYHAFVENLIPIMGSRSIRAWHYTRLTDYELKEFLQTGPILSDLNGIRKRLESQVDAGAVMPDAARRLLEDSPFQVQGDIRSNRFWAASHPISFDNSGVELLLGHWGGEGVYFWQKDEGLVSLLQSIGTSRILEIEIPLSSTNRSFQAGRSVVSAFAKSIGLEGEDRGFDVCVIESLGPQTILATHSAGESTFENVGKTYPTRLSACL